MISCLTKAVGAFHCDNFNETLETALASDFKPKQDWPGVNS